MQTMDTEQTNDGLSAAEEADRQAALEALASGSSDDTPPSEEVSQEPAPEAAQAEEGAEPREEDARTDDAPDTLDVADSDLDQRIKFSNGESVTMKQLLEAWNSRSDADVIRDEHKKLDLERKRIENAKASLGFADVLDIPHKALTNYLGGLVQSKRLHPKMYEYVSEAFARGIDEGIYSMEGAERTAMQSRKMQTLAQREAEIERKNSLVEAKSEVIELRAKHGRDFTKEEGAAMMKYMESERLKKRDLTLAEVYEELSKSKVIKKTVAAPVSVRKMADKWRTRPASTQTVPIASSKDEALAQLIANLGKG